MNRAKEDKLFYEIIVSTLITGDLIASAFGISSIIQNDYLSEFFFMLVIFGAVMFVVRWLVRSD